MDHEVTVASLSHLDRSEKRGISLSCRRHSHHVQRGRFGIVTASLAQDRDSAKTALSLHQAFDNLNPMDVLILNHVLFRSLKL